MSETVDTKKRRVPVKRTPILRKKGVDLTGFKTWLETLKLNITPAVHVNGSDHSSAILVLDFGTPKESIRKFENDEVAELNDWLKKLTREITGRDDNRVSVMTDNSNGVWWTSTTN